MKEVIWQKIEGKYAAKEALIGSEAMRYYERFFTRNPGSDRSRDDREQGEQTGERSNERRRDANAGERTSAHERWTQPRVPLSSMSARRLPRLRTSLHRAAAGPRTTSSGERVRSLQPTRCRPLRRARAAHPRHVGRAARRVRRCSRLPDRSDGRSVPSRIPRRRQIEP